MAQKLPIRLRTLAATVVVVASGMIIFNAYQSIINSTDEPLATLPIVAADTQPYRVRPENPGGMDIPNKGNRVFDLLKNDNDDAMALDGIDIESNNQSDFDDIDDYNASNDQGFEIPETPVTKTESLFASIPEETTKKEEAKKTLPSSAPQQALKEKLEQAIAKTQAIDPSGPVESQTKQENIIVAPSVPLPKSKPVIAKKIKAAAKPKTTSKPKEAFSLDRILAQTPTEKRHYIQLASLKSEADARAAYNNIREKFPNLVQGASAFFPKANLGEFTRIQIGPFDASVARARCADYSTQSNGGTCLVISR